MHATAEERFAALRARLAAEREEDAELARTKRRKARVEKKAKERARAGEDAAEPPVTLASKAASEHGMLGGADDSGVLPKVLLDAGEKGLDRTGGTNPAKHKGPPTRDVRLTTLNACAPRTVDLQTQEALAMRLLAMRGL
jgi:FtsP/CotA-like multicopper oxidase with cupredoxin domain